MPTLTAPDGAHLAYTDVGSGPPVLLLHGWSLDAGMWEYQVAALVEAGYRCVTPDRRGHGRSEVVGVGYDIDTLADDVAALAEQLDLRDVTLVAHSMGTCEAVRWLGRGTDRVARAVLVGAMTPHLVGTVGEAFVEALVVHGDADASAPLEITGKPTADFLPRARLSIHLGGPHGLYVTGKEALNAELLDLIATGA